VAQVSDSRQQSSVLSEVLHSAWTLNGLGFWWWWTARLSAEVRSKGAAHIERAWLLAELWGGRLSELLVANPTMTYFNKLAAPRVPEELASAGWERAQGRT